MVQQRSCPTCFFPLKLGVSWRLVTFIQRLILTDSPLSVVWWQALFCLTSCWFALLRTKTVKFILWALYFQPTLKWYSHTALSSVRSPWLGKGPEQNTLKYWSQCFHYMLRAAQTIWTYSELLHVNFWRDMTGDLKSFIVKWTVVLRSSQRCLTVVQHHRYAGKGAVLERFLWM